VNHSSIGNWMFKIREANSLSKADKDMIRSYFSRLGFVSIRFRKDGLGINATLNDIRYYGLYLHSSGHLQHISRKGV
jgi:hypothetical protein